MIATFDTLSTERDLVGALAIFLLERTGSIWGKWSGRLSKAEQRAAFGCVPFGKCRVKIDGLAETVNVLRKVAFGKDWEETTRTWLELDTLARANRHPFSLGRGLLTLPL